jgi:hypothetical protein
MSGVAIIQGGPKGHPHAPLWYGSNPVEPIGNKSTISVTDTKLLETVSLEAFFDQIIAAKASEVVIVNHGDGSGLAVPLQKGSTAGAQREVMFSLGADVSREEIGIGGAKMKTPVKSDKDVADLTRLTEPQVKALRAKMNQVRALKMQHVAFRACSMGLHEDTLEAFRNVFGCASVSAPKEFDSYGTFRPSIGADLEGWAKSMRKRGFQIAIDGQVAFGTKPTDSPIVYSIESRAPDDDTFSAWVKKHITDGEWKTNGVVFHGMKLLHPTSATSPTVAFVRDSSFVSRLVYYAG